MESTTLESTTCETYFLYSLFSASLKDNTVGFHEASWLLYCLLVRPHASPETSLVLQSVLTTPQGVETSHPTYKKDTFPKETGYGNTRAKI